MVKVLILGANGQLGSQFQKRSAEFPGTQLVALGRGDLDLSDRKAVETYLSANHADVVINCSGFTAVDLAEEHSKQAFLINEEVPALLAEICGRQQIPFIHFSTDYVFDGNSNRPYMESDPIQPLNVYGASKAAGERRVLENSETALVIRVAWLFSELGKNFFLSMIRLGREKSEISVVDDQVSSPTYAGFLVRDVLTLISRTSEKAAFPKGIFHYSCSGTCSWKEFASAIFELDGSSCKVNPVSSAIFGAAANRPKFSKLNNTKWLQATHLPAYSWEDGLKLCYSEYLKEHGNEAFGTQSY